MASSFAATIAESEGAVYGVDFAVSVAASENAAKSGELMYFDTSTQTLKRCGADPALIAGIFEAGDSNVARLLTPNNRVPFRLLHPTSVVRMCSATTPAETHVAVSTGYGVVRDANGNWAVDITDTSNPRVFVLRVDIPAGAFYVKFWAANLQFDAIAS